MVMRPIDFMIGAWPILPVVILWALFLGPKSCPSEPVMAIEAKEKARQGGQVKLPPMVDKVGIDQYGSR